jgi:hypothetical protein
MGSVVAMGTAATFGMTGFEVTAGSNTMTTFSARATDAAGNPSLCSGNIVYVHDDIRPDPPMGLFTTPASPSNINDLVVKGTAEVGSRIRLHDNADCSGTFLVMGLASDFATTGFAVNVGDDTTTSFSATATDAAGNRSDCSAAIVYVEDSTPPAPPSGLGTTPGSHTDETNISVFGTAAAGSTVSLYGMANCGGAVIAMGSAAMFASPGFGAMVGDNTSTTFSARASDSIGNPSMCSGNIVYVEDSSPPTFGGVVTGVFTDPTTVDLTWASAMDATLPADMEYLICYSTNPGDCLTTFTAINLTFGGPGETPRGGPRGVSY